MATVNKDFIVRNGIVVSGTTATVNGNQVLTEASSINALNDIIITSATTGQVLKFNGTNWVNDTDATGGGGGTLDDLTDVTITSVTTGQIIQYSTTGWINRAGPYTWKGEWIASDTVNYSYLQNDLVAENGKLYVAINNVSGSIGVPSSDTDNWIFLTTSFSYGYLDNLKNVVLTSISNGQVLKYNNGAWVNSADNSANSFATIAVSGQGNVVATSATDTLTFVAGTFISITTVTASDSITFSAAHSHAIDDLSDVTITSAATNQTLVYSTTGQWVNATPSSGGISAGQAIIYAMVFG